MGANETNGQAVKTLLLVDDEPNILSALTRVLRLDGYRILTATGGAAALALLENETVDVIVSDQRMPGMLGVDFLRQAKALYPSTIRIMLSGYTELQSVTAAVNEGAIYRFLTKPWDDEQLRANIADGFRMKAVGDENVRLYRELSEANAKLAAANAQMRQLVQEKQEQIVLDEISLAVARELLSSLPLPVIGLDDQETIVFINDAAAAMFGDYGLLLGQSCSTAMPQLHAALAQDGAARSIELAGRRYQVQQHAMGSKSASRGTLITLSQ
ncbi:response regulator [Massilia endophytica]|uniref:response regulator n=1 Tax=Massilia endophytica TaxID=2899220 RepID=UPI001E29033B|nr:response regulator [Massilia endophytica]UGQ49128.1 response regulator [Massilia endophytica]